MITIAILGMKYSKKITDVHEGVRGPNRNYNHMFCHKTEALSLADICATLRYTLRHSARKYANNP